MALRGDLASVGLADVFQMLAHNQKVGILSIHGQEAWKALYFDRRGVTLYYNEHGFLDRLLESLVRRNYVQPDLLDALRRQNTGDPIGTVEALLSGGLIQEELFLESFRTQMEEEIYDLFLWENVHWEFLEGESAVEGQDGVVNENFFFSADTLIMEAARRLDEWVFIREQVPGPLEVFETIPGYSAHEVVGLDELALSILDLVDGKRNVQRIVEVSQITSFQAHKSLSTLAQKGFIQALPEHKLMANANECIAEARLDDGIRLLEKAVQVGAGIPEANLIAARTYEMQSEVARAAWHYKCYAAHRLDMGATDEAVQTLEHSISIVPTDLEAWERLLHGLMLQATPKLDPHAVGKDLIDLYLELDETDRARRVLEDLLKARPHDIELKKTLIAVHTKTGDQRRVMDLYESIADDLVAQKDPIGAVRYLQKILMIDRNRREISDRIKQLYVMDEKHRSRRRSLALVMAGLLCAGTLGTIYYLYERNVWKAYYAIDLDPFVKESDFLGGIRMLEDFRSRYPLSFVESEVSKDIEKLRGLQRLKEAQEEAERQKLAANARRLRRQYQDLWDLQRAQTLENLDMQKDLQILEQIKALALQAGEAVDEGFLREKKIDLALRTTREYLDKAASLSGQCEEAWRRGEFASARTLALQLNRDHPHSPAAKGCRVPFEVVTEPPGAEVAVDGEVWRSDANGPLTTPLWVRLPFADAAQVKLSRAGHEDLYRRVKGSDESPLRLLLRVKPDLLIDLGSEAVTGIGVGETVGIVGLRGGKLLGIELATGKERFQRSLPGLDEVLGTPVIFDREKLAVYATTHGSLYGVRLSDGEVVWGVKTEGSVRTALTAVRGGVVFGNHRGELVMHDLASGDMLWTYPTEASPTSDPMWDGDLLFYANREGLLLGLDVEAIDEVVLELRNGTGAVTGPMRVGKYIALLGVDGKVRGFERRRNAPLAWEMPYSDPGTEGFMLPDPAGVLLVTPDGTVQRVDPKIRKVLQSRTLPRPLAAGVPPVRTDRALFFVSRGEKGNVHVTSLDAADLSLRWDYELERGIKGRVTVFGRKLFVVGADGRVHVLK